MNNSPSKEQLINQAIKFHSQGNIIEATKCYQTFINNGYKDIRVFSNYGIILKNLGNLKEAELYTRKAIKMEPLFANAYYNLGNILIDLGKFKEAELTYLQAIKLNPNCAKSHYNLGNLFKNLGNLKEAKFSYFQAIKLDPLFANAYTNLGNLFIDIGNLKEAELYTRKAIELNPNLAMAYSNLGSILRDVGNLKEAELSHRKAIEIDPLFADAYYNLAGVLRDIGNLKEAELSYFQAIELNPNHANAFFALSTLELSNENKIWRDNLFSKNLLNNKSKEDKVNIYFARANILHKERKYENSSKYLELANNLALKLNPCNSFSFINKSLALIEESYKESVIQKENTKYPQCIFIVGMPRSGSTLLESTLTMNNNVDDLGEINILEESFLQYKKCKSITNLAELYWKKVNLKTKLNISTNKWLYNYQYAGIIASHIPNARIIHCFRNPLDNILSIYRANFTSGNEYSSSLVDSAKVYLDQDEVMTQYKKRFKTKIYNLNYDSLVTNPNKEIRSLISWLGWKWDNQYLSPHLNPRSVRTASNVQVRSPINTKSLGGWKNYKEMLRPAMEIITKKDKYKDIKY